MERKLQMGTWYGMVRILRGPSPSSPLPTSPYPHPRQSSDRQIGWQPLPWISETVRCAVAVGERTPGSWQRRSPSMVAGLLLLAALGAVAPSDKAKNFVIMLADDMGCAPLLFFNLLPLRLD